MDHLGEGEVLGEEVEGDAGQLPQVGVGAQVLAVEVAAAGAGAEVPLDPCAAGHQVRP